MKGYHFHLTSAGVQENPREGYQANDADERCSFLVFCDAIIPAERAEDVDEVETEAVARLCERFIADHLKKLPSDALHEESITHAFRYAHEQIKKYGEHCGKEVAVSALVLASTTDLDDLGNPKLLAACAGDCRLYRIKAETAELAAFDPENKNQAPDLDPKERVDTLTNAIGINCQPQVTCRTLPATSFGRYVAVSYGACQNLRENHLWEIGHRPRDPNTGATHLLTQQALLANSQKLMTITYGSARATQERLPHAVDAIPTPCPADAAESAKRKKLVLALSGIAAVMVATLSLLTLSQPQPTVAVATPSGTSHAQPQVDPEPPKRYAEEEQDTLSPLSQLREVNQHLQRNLESTRQQLYDVHEQLKAATGENDRSLFEEMTTQLGVKQRTIDELRGKLAAVEPFLNKTEQLEQQLEEKSAAVSALSRDKVELIREVAQKTQEYASANDKLKQASALKRQVDDLQFRIEELKEVNASLEQEVAQQHNDVALIQSQANEINTLEVQLGTKTDLIAQLMREKNQLLERMGFQSEGQAEETFDQLREELDEKTQNISRLDYENRELKKVLAHRDEKVRFLEQNLVLLDDMKRTIDSKDAEIEQLLAERRELKTALEGRQKKAQLIEKNLNFVSALEDQLAMAEKRNQEMAAQTAAQSRDLQKTTSRIAFLEEELNTITDLQEALNRKEEEIAALQKDRFSIEQELGKYRAQIAHLERTANTLQEVIAERPEDATTAEQIKQWELYARSQEKAVEELQDLLASSEQENAQLNKELNNLYTSGASNNSTATADLRDRLAAATQEKEELLDTIRALRQNQEHGKEAYAATIQTAAQVEGKLRSIQQENHVLRDQLNQAKAVENHLRSALAENERLMESEISHQGDSTRKLRETQAHLSELERENQRLQALLHEAQKWQREAKTQETATPTSRQELTRIEERNRELTTQLIQKENELNELMEGQGETSLQLNELMAERNKLLQDRALMAEQIAQLRDLRERYEAEKDLRLQREDRFSQLARGLEEQREALTMFEESRRELLEEIRTLRKENERLRGTSPRSTASATTSSHQQIASVSPIAMQEVRSHTVRRGDTLSSISLRYYGTPHRWQDIYEANREKIPNTNQISVGTRLVIPD